jgi:hypothetical protein
MCLIAPAMLYPGFVSVYLERVTARIQLAGSNRSSKSIKEHQG